MDQKMAELQNIGYKSYYQPQEYVENPKYTATWQMTDEERKQKRKAGELNEIFVDINPEKLPEVDTLIAKCGVDRLLSMARVGALEARRDGSEIRRQLTYGDAPDMD